MSKSKNKSRGGQKGVVAQARAKQSSKDTEPQTPPPPVVVPAIVTPIKQHRHNPYAEITMQDVPAPLSTTSVDSPPASLSERKRTLHRRHNSAPPSLLVLTLRNHALWFGLNGDVTRVGYTADPAYYALYTQRRNPRDEPSALRSFAQGYMSPCLLPEEEMEDERWRREEEKGSDETYGAPAQHSSRSGRWKIFEAAQEESLRAANEALRAEGLRLRKEISMESQRSEKIIFEERTAREISERLFSELHELRERARLLREIAYHSKVADIFAKKPKALGRARAITNGLDSTDDKSVQRIDMQSRLEQADQRLAELRQPNKWPRREQQHVRERISVETYNQQVEEERESRLKRESEALETELNRLKCNLAKSARGWGLATKSQKSQLSMLESRVQTLQYNYRQEEEIDQRNENQRRKKNEEQKCKLERQIHEERMAAAAKLEETLECHRHFLGMCLKGLAGDEALVRADIEKMQRMSRQVISLQLVLVSTLQQ